MSRKAKGRLVIDGKKGLRRETRDETKRRQHVKHNLKAGIADALPVASPKPTATVTRAISDAFARWRDDRVQLSVLATELSVKRSKLRRSFQQLAGGKPAFAALRAKGAGGTTEPFGGKRATGGRTREVIARDDSKVPTIASCRASDGWKVERKLRGRLISVKDVGTMQWREIEYLIHVAPDGTRYVRATTTEKADLIVTGAKNLAPVRLRKLETASIAKAAKQEQKEVERGQHALKRTRERKRAAKLSRRTTNVKA